MAFSLEDESEDVVNQEARAACAAAVSEIPAGPDRAGQGSAAVRQCRDFVVNGALAKPA
jgi:hypothetical protein